MCLLSIVGLVAFLTQNALIALLYNETQPVKEDALSRLDSNFEIIMLIYRVLIGTLTQFCYAGFCSWIMIAISVVSSVYFLFQYFKYLPYYNSFVSIFFGSMLSIYCWVSLNAVLMEFYHISGHILIILMGIPIVCRLVVYLRD